MAEQSKARRRRKQTQSPRRERPTGEEAEEREEGEKALRGARPCHTPAPQPPTAPVMACWEKAST